MNTQFKKGILEMCILHLLSEEDLYGYMIIKKIQSLFDNTDESTIYAILRRLNSLGLTDLYYKDSSDGPKRKYYSINKKGLQYLNNYIMNAKELYNILSKLGIKF